MFPIGIVTRDRFFYLDITLRSLSATQLPAGQSVTVYDDGSNDNLTLDYYKTSRVINVSPHWPSAKLWKAHGLNIISDGYTLPTGIADRVAVHSIGRQSGGVINASCRAICHLFEANPDANGIILLQDDVIFKEDWYARITDTLERHREYADRHVGLLAGLKISYKFPPEKLPKTIAVNSGITAQCLYISRPAFNAMPDYFKANHVAKQKFDDTLRRAMNRGNFWAGCIYPFVCQHFGVQSLVRPERKWHHFFRGRVGYYVQPPYVLADQVKHFKSGVP